MPIDDPIDSSKGQADAEHRSEVIPFKGESAALLTAFLTIAAATSHGALAITTAAGGAVLTGFQTLVASVGIRRQQELIYAVYDGFQQRGATKEYLEERLRGATENVQELVAESVVRASEAKSTEAVRRIARLLTSVLLTKEAVNVEEIRAMLAIAGSLFELDAITLGRMHEMQAPAVLRRTGKIDVNDVLESWKRLTEAYPAMFNSPSIIASGSRLQAHGLAMRGDRTGMETTFGLDTWVFSITDFGIRFCQWCLVGIN